MKLNKTSISWIIWAISLVCFGLMMIFDAAFFDGEVYGIRILPCVLLAVGFPLSEFFNRKKINKLKKDLSVTEDISLDELESLRIERDYQENYVNKWRHASE